MIKFRNALLFLALFAFATSCHDYFNDTSGDLDLEESRQNRKGQDNATTSEDEDSDKPDWAGGNTDDNPHIRGNDDSGTTRGGDYGDLYILLRDANGVPGMIEIDDPVEWYVQPIDANGNTLELDAEGELVHPELAIEVDFGRLNIVRSPQSVLDQALEEALKVLAAPGAEITLDFCGRLTSTYYDPVLDEVIVKTIDSPRENMALYQYVMKFMFENTAENNWNNRLGFLKGQFDPMMIAASCFAAGSDKTGTVDIDEVVYIDGFIECTGLNPIKNEHEYDFNHDNKYYFNFGDCYGDGSYKFQYSRQETYQNRYLAFQVLDGVYYPDWSKVMSVIEFMETYGKFSQPWPTNVEDTELVAGFALAVDDAVQVLEAIHGDSNIKFLPDYTE